MISVLISPTGRAPAQNNKVRQIINSFLKKNKIDDVEISLKFIGKQEMRQLNKKYRDIDKTTAVLSFSQQEEKEGQAFKEPPRVLKTLGDIVICLEEAKRQGQPLEQLLIHGLKNLIKLDEQRPGLLSQISSSKSLRT